MGLGQLVRRYIVQDVDGNIVTTTALPGSKRGLDVNATLTGTAGTEFDEGDSIDTDSQGTLMMGTTGVPGSAKAIRVNSSGELFAEAKQATHDNLNLNANIQVGNTDVGGGNPVPISGSVTADTELPAAAALSDNFANPTAPAVGSFMMSWDGATWDRSPGNSTDGLLVNLGANNDVTVTGSVTADTELPAAAALSENFANPTAPAVGSFLMVWDGATWDRLPGTSTDGALVNLGTNNDIQGQVASDVAVSGNPVVIGLEARTTNPTALVDGRAIRAKGDDIGRMVVVHNHVRDLKVQQYTQITNTTETTILSAGGSGVLLDLTFLRITNKSNVPVVVSLRDATGGTIIDKINLCAKGGVTEPHDETYLQTTANNNWTAQLDVTATVDIKVHAVKNV